MNHKLISNSNYVLSQIFLKKENQDILKNFIENIIDIKIFKILEQKRIKYSHKDEYGGIVEVQVQTVEDKILNIGIQIVDGRYVPQKFIIYGTAISTCFNQNSPNTTITINILNNNFFPTGEYCQKVYFPQDNIIFYVLELPKVNNKIENEKDAWANYLKGENIGSIEEAKNKVESIKQLDKKLDEFWIKEIL